MQTLGVFVTLGDMVIDGISITEDLKHRLQHQTKARAERLRVGVIVVERTPQADQFLAAKQRFAKSINVDLDVLTLPTLSQTTEYLLQLILRAPMQYNGLILQLPVPERYDLDQILRLFPLPLDIDVLGITAYEQFQEGTLPFMPPVVAACAEILHRNQYVLAGRTVVIVGEGRLVGAPAAVWARRMGALVSVANRRTEDLASLTRTADIIILGAGVPGLLTPDMVQQGVVVLDAGTSESAGVVKGDADPAVAEKAALFTPTPGGIGPITVAKVFENLLALDHLKHARNTEQANLS